MKLLDPMDTADSRIADVDPAEKASRRARVILISAVLVALGTLAWLWALPVWHEATIGWSSYDPMLILWIVLLVLGAALGALNANFARPSQPILTSTKLGAVYGTGLLLWTPPPSLVASAITPYAWFYGLFLMAPLGSIRGALSAALVGRLRHRRSDVTPRARAIIREAEAGREFGWTRSRSSI